MEAEASVRAATELVNHVEASMIKYAETARPSAP
jgi:hypothetical protein